MFVLAVFGVWMSCASGYVWPNPKLDEMEKLLCEQSGRDTGNIVAVARGYNGPLGVNGHDFGAEQIRNAYDDMATADVHTGVGGMDASVAFEQDRDENRGKALTKLVHPSTPISPLVPPCPTCLR